MEYDKDIVNDSYNEAKNADEMRAVRKHTKASEVIGVNG
jgi:hypothetical protein